MLPPIVKSMMQSHAWSGVVAPGLNLGRSEVQEALLPYVWAVSEPICLCDLAVLTVEVTDAGVKAFPNKKGISEHADIPEGIFWDGVEAFPARSADACVYVPDYIFKAFPEGFYRDLLGKYPG